MLYTPAIPDVEQDVAVDNSAAASPNNAPSPRNTPEPNASLDSPIATAFDTPVATASDTPVATVSDAPEDEDHVNAGSPQTERDADTSDEASSEDEPVRCEIREFNFVFLTDPNNLNENDRDVTFHFDFESCQEADLAQFEDDA